VALIRTNVPEEHIASMIRVTRIGELAEPIGVKEAGYEEMLSRGCLRGYRYRHPHTYRLLVTANVFPNSPILVTLMMEAIRSSKTSVLTRATQGHIPEDGILQEEC
jgi:hypothetical protein